MWVYVHANSSHKSVAKQSCSNHRGNQKNTDEGASKWFCCIVLLICSSADDARMSLNAFPEMSAEGGNEFNENFSAIVRAYIQMYYIRRDPCVKKNVGHVDGNGILGVDCSWESRLTVRDLRDMLVFLRRILLPSQDVHADKF